jgi:hypothetical protein
VRLEQIDLAAAVHLPFDEFELCDLALGLAIRPLRDDGIADRVDILFNPVRKESNETFLGIVEASGQR